MHIIGRCQHESTSGALCRAPLDNERWLAQFHADAEKLKNENANAEPDSW